MTYKEIADEFTANPRDVHTVPRNGKAPLWFYVHTEGGVMYATPAEAHEPSSSMKNPIPIKESELEDMLKLYRRRQSEEAVSKEAKDSSWAQAYWYGIFNDLGL